VPSELTVALHTTVAPSRTTMEAPGAPVPEIPGLGVTVLLAAGAAIATTRAQVLGAPAQT
jgi:hypothetical protein